MWRRSNRVEFLLFRNILTTVSHNSQPQSNMSHHRRSEFTLRVCYVRESVSRCKRPLRLCKGNKHWAALILWREWQGSHNSPKNRLNRWIHTKKHRNTSKSSLLYSFYRKKVKIMIFRVRRHQYSISHTNYQRSLVTRHRFSCEKVNSLITTGSPSSKYEHRRTSALLRNILNIRICMGRKPIVSVTYKNERFQ